MFLAMWIAGFFDEQFLILKYFGFYCVEKSDCLNQSEIYWRYLVKDIEIRRTVLDEGMPCKT